VLDQLRKAGYTGGYSIVRGFVRERKEESGRIAYLRFETDPGRQAQVDFGEFKVVAPDGGERSYYLFCMVLGYSRQLYGEYLTRCDMVSFLDAHQRAFDAFGGVPAECVSRHPGLTRRRRRILTHPGLVKSVRGCLSEPFCHRCRWVSFRRRLPPKVGHYCTPTDTAEMRGEAARGLARLHAPGAAVSIAPLLRDRVSDVRVDAAKALGYIGTRDVVEPLISALTTKDLELRHEAAWQLGRLTGQNLGMDATRWGQWWQQHPTGPLTPVRKCYGSDWL
jgi:hypothetical protein